MTLEEFNQIDWKRGNLVRLNNGKEYSCCYKKDKVLVLWTYEYKKLFNVSYKIIEARTSTRILPYNPKKKNNNGKDKS